jgi:hypothetical protein
MTDESAASRVEDWLRVMAGNAGFRTTRELKSYQNAEKQILDIVHDQHERLQKIGERALYLRDNATTVEPSVIKVTAGLIVETVLGSEANQK